MPDDYHFINTYPFRNKSIDLPAYIVKFNFGNAQGAFKYLVITNDRVVNLKRIKNMTKPVVSSLNGFGLWNRKATLFNSPLMV